MVIKNEQTSKPVASIAAKFMHVNDPAVLTGIDWKKIKSVLASTLTQAPDKEKGLTIKKWKAMNRPKKK